MIKKEYNVEVEGYSFEELSPRKNVIREFKPQDFHDFEKKKLKLDENVIRQQRLDAGKKDFNFIDEIVEHRGIKKQALEDDEKRIEVEVEKRLKLAQEKAYQEGLQIGREEGFAESKKNADEEFKKQIDQLCLFIEELQKERKKLLEDNKDEIYRLIKTLVKWVSFREFTKDSYLPQLLEKLILELNEKHNLLIKVNRSDFDVMPGVVEMIEEKMGKLVNCRVEIETDLKSRGIILESERGIIDASMEVQFDKIDKLFEPLKELDE